MSSASNFDVSANTRASRSNSSRRDFASKNCQFAADQVDDEIAGQIVQGCLSDKLRRQLLQLAELSLKTLLERGRVHDTVEGQARALEEKERLNAVRAKTNPPFQKPFAPRTKPHQREQPTVSNGRPYRFNPGRCDNCGGVYPHVSSCPARGKTCNSCGVENHFSSCCHNSARSRPPPPRWQRDNRQRLNAVGLSSPPNNAPKCHSKVNGDFDLHDYSRGQLFSIANGGKLPLTFVTVNGISVKVLVDTGCSTKS